MAAALLALLPAGALAGSGIFSASQGPRYEVSRIEVEYASAHPDQPPLGDLRRIRVALGITPDGFVGARRGGKNRWFRLRQLEKDGDWSFYASGLRELNEQIVEFLNERGLIGVYVAPSPEDIEPGTGRDLRPPERTALRLLVYTGHVRGLRTFSSDETPALEQRVDRPTERWIAEGSPLQPESATQPADLLRQGELDAYIARLNRHPGRRVDAALTPSLEPGGVFVDFMVSEAKPWEIYSQLSDTGTDQTDEWRQRFGFRHNELTGRDDILRLDYVTSSFDELNAVIGSYEAPVQLPWIGDFRAAVRGSWSEYTADQLGFDGNFEGRGWQAGAELIYPVLQRGEWFGDLLLGARWWNVEVDNFTFTGDSDFFLPSAQFRLERATRTSSFQFLTDLEMNLPDVADSADEDSDFAKLGRADIDEDWLVAHWNLDFSFYLEPWLDPRRWANPGSPSSSTLAHEVSLATRGQYAFGNRLIPQAQMVLGGFYTVRGYQQALLAADSVVLVRAEYRYHLPMALAIRGEPAHLPWIGDFRVAPPRVYGRPDWDLVLRVFSDFGRAFYSDAVGGEEDQTLWGAGVGVELVIRRNLSLRVDWAFALDEIPEDGVDSGDSEMHLIATLRY